MSRFLAGSVVALMIPGTAPTALDDRAAFLAALLDGIRAHNPQQVARLFQYPFRMTVAGIPYPVSVRTRAEMVRMYDIVFNPTMRCAIELSRLPTRAAPHPAYKLALAEGVVSLADGRVIAARTNDGFKITRFSLLPGSKPPSRPPQTLTLWSKQAQIQASGRLGYDDTDVYLIRVRGGAELAARIEGFPGSSLLLRVREAHTNQLLHGASTELARSWISRIQRTGEYRIEVARNTPYCDPDVTYVLTVAVR